MNTYLIKKTVITILLFPILTIGNQNNSKITDNENTVISISEKWLIKIDKMDYDWCYNNADKIIQERISIKEWNKTMNAVLDPLGEKISRNVNKVSFHTELPGVPDGKYAIITYNTSFKYKDKAIETISLVNIDNQWRVAGYFIR